MRDCALPSLKGPLCFYRRTCFQYLSCQAASCCIQQLCIWLKYGTITPTCWEANEGLLKDIILELHYLPRVSCVLFYFLPILPCRSFFQAAHLAALNVPRHVLFALTYTCVRLWSHFLSATGRSSPEVLSRCSPYLFSNERLSTETHPFSTLPGPQEINLRMQQKGEKNSLCAA